MTTYAFKETKEASIEITRLFDFVWPTAIALWNLRWQVNGFLDAVPNASYEQVHSRFVIGSGIHGADIRAMCTRISWDEQEARFVDFILTNAFAIYESWARQIVARSSSPKFSDKDLYRIGNGTSSGVSAFISHTNTTPSIVMANAFKPQFARRRKNFLSIIDNMLKCYKYFKEIRNCRMHNGGLADQKAVDAFNDFLPVSSAASMKTKEPLEQLPVVLGAPAAATIRGVVGFCDIILRLMTTIETEISGSKMAQDAMLVRLLENNTPMPTLSSNPSRASQQVRKICNNGGLPIPVDEKVVQQFFYDNRIAGR